MTKVPHAQVMEETKQIPGYTLHQLGRSAGGVKLTGFLWAIWSQNLPFTLKLKFMEPMSGEHFCG